MIPFSARKPCMTALSDHVVSDPSIGYAKGLCIFFCYERDMCLHTFPVGNSVPHHPEAPVMHSNRGSLIPVRFEQDDFSLFGQA